MPQLDIQIFFLDSFVCFFTFWALYVYNAKIVFPEIKRVIILREIKILSYKFLIKNFNSYFSYWELHFKSIEEKSIVKLYTVLNKSMLKTSKKLTKYGLILHKHINDSMSHAIKNKIISLNISKQILIKIK